MLQTALLLVLLSLPRVWFAPGQNPETDVAYAARMATVAAAIDYATAHATCRGVADGCEPSWPGEEEDLAAALVALAWHESRLSLRVHRGRCPKGFCPSAARSLWQVEESALVPHAIWTTLEGTDEAATARAAAAATRVLSVGRSRCGSTWGAIGMYASGRSCRWSGTAARWATFRRVRAELRASLAPSALASR